jgi:hypothetical protein
MALKKLEWLADYREHSLGSIKVERSPGKEEHRASDAIIEYKKGQIINVEERGDGIFRDTDTGEFFSVNNPNSKYRLF